MGDESPEGAPAVVVGIDDRPGSRAALRYALDEARWRRLPLRLVHVVAAGREDETAPVSAVERAREAAVSLAIRSGSAIGALVDETTVPGTWLVVGADHVAGDQFSPGCISVGVLARAACPVTVVPPGWSGSTVPARVIVVAPDDGGLPESVLASEFAGVWGLPLDHVTIAADDPRAVETATARLLERLGPADMVFIGRRQQDEPHPSLALAPALIARRAPCPVVVVPDDTDPTAFGSPNG